MTDKYSSLSELHVIGAGGLARDFFACFKNEVNIVGFWDDGVVKGTLIKGIPVLGNLNELCSNLTPLVYVIMVANPQVRKKIAEKIKSSSHSSVVIIHSLARIFDKDTVTIGKGTVVFPGSMITTAVTVGEHTLIHTNCSVHHDSKIGSYCVMMPGARLTGNSEIGHEVYVGPNISVTNGMRVGNGERIER